MPGRSKKSTVSPKALAGRTTYSPVANAFYLYLRSRGKFGRMVKVSPTVNADFDQQGRLIGIEVLDARFHLPRKLLEGAIRLDRKR